MKKSIEELVHDVLKTEYSEEFDERRKAVVINSFYKYGHAKVNFETNNVDAIKTLEMCLQKFKDTKNTEYLLDVANYAMFRYMYPQEGEYFKYTDSKDSAGLAGISEKEIERLKEGTTWVW